MELLGCAPSVEILADLARYQLQPGRVANCATLPPGERRIQRGVWDSPCQSALDRPVRAGSCGKIRKLVIAPASRQLWQNDSRNNRRGDRARADGPANPAARGFVSSRLRLWPSRRDGLAKTQGFGYQLAAVEARRQMSVD